MKNFNKKGNATEALILLIVVVAIVLGSGVGRMFMNDLSLSFPTTTPALTQPPSPSPQPSQPLTNPTGTVATGTAFWPMFDADGARSGTNTGETIINTTNVNTLRQIWKISLPDVTDGSPVGLSGVQTAGGVKDLIYITTTKGSLLAIDSATGTIFWQKDTNGPKYTTSSPALDSAKQFVFSYGLDGFAHKYTVDSGTEVTAGGWPAKITNMTNTEKGSSALTIANGYLYVTTAGYPGDAPPYQGHAVAVNLSNGAEGVFNSLCANIHQVLAQGACGSNQSGIWARAGVVVDPASQNVFVATGNGNYNASAGGTNYGDSIIELSSDLSRIIDSYTPTVYGKLDASDADLGSTAPVLLPGQNNTATPDLLVQGSKDNTLRLINKQNMSGQGLPNHVGGEIATAPIGCEVFSQPVAWNDTSGQTWVYVGTGCGLLAYKIVNANNASTLARAYQVAGSTSPVIVNNILYIEGNNAIRAVDPATGTNLWIGAIQGTHWQSPIVFNGHLYVPDNAGNLYSFGL